MEGEGIENVFPYGSLIAAVLYWQQQQWGKLEACPHVKNILVLHLVLHSNYYFTLALY